ncbi:MAG: EamA family transporter [Actinobacteria bacterium]|nr:EamA family transporter [Actinomycetota bacterium]
MSDFLGGLKSRSLQLLTVLVVSQTIGLAVITTVVGVLGTSPPPGRYLLYAALAGAGGVVGLAALYRGMAVGAMAVVAPVSALAAIIPVCVGIAGGERPSAPQYAGIALALAGAALVSTQSRSGSAGGRLATGVGLALVAAAGFGLFFVGIDAARERSLVWAVLMTRLASTALVVVAVVWARPRLSVGRRDWPALAAVGVLDLGANALFAAAADRGYVSLVSVLASLYSVGVIALAAVVLGERLERLQWLGAAAALAGVALIATG